MRDLGESRGVQPSVKAIGGDSEPFRYSKGREACIRIIVQELEIHSNFVQRNAIFGLLSCLAEFWNNLDTQTQGTV